MIGLSSKGDELTDYMALSRVQSTLATYFHLISPCGLDPIKFPKTLRTTYYPVRSYGSTIGKK